MDSEKMVHLGEGDQLLEALALILKRENPVFQSRGYQYTAIKWVGKIASDPTIDLENVDGRNIFRVTTDSITWTLRTHKSPGSRSHGRLLRAFRRVRDRFGSTSASPRFTFIEDYIVHAKRLLRDHSNQNDLTRTLKFALWYLEADAAPFLPEIENVLDLGVPETYDLSVRLLAKIPGDESTRLLNLIVSRSAISRSAAKKAEKIVRSRDMKSRD